MKTNQLRTVLLLIVASVSAFAQQRGTSGDTGAIERNVVAVTTTADLSISKFVFITGNEKVVRVHVVNSGGAPAPLCILRLTVRKINGIPAGRTTEIKLPPMAAGKDRWLLINAGRILPHNVSLEATTFKLNAVATSIVAESDEANNEVWHNL